MSTWDPHQGLDGSTTDEGPVFVKEQQFLDDPEAWARRADEVPRVVVTSDDGECVRFVIVQQREPID